MSGILIVGLNGAGKTTLGRVLAEALGFRRMDVEDYYFPPVPSSGNPYAVSRTKEQVRLRMLEDIRSDGRFVLSAVNGDWGDEILSNVGAIVALEAPREVRLARIDRRSAERFGHRVAPGGDMFEQERRFRDIAAARSQQPIDEWLRIMRVPVLRLDSTQPVDRCLCAVIEWLATINLTGDRHALS